MTATFNPALTSTLDKIRFDIGDTNVQDPVVQDETILAKLAEAGATQASVSASLAHYVLTIYSQRVTYDVDGQGERFSDMAKNYAAVVARLQALADEEARQSANDDEVAAGVAMGGGIMPMGLSHSGNQDRMRDCDRAANYSARGERL